MQIKRRQRARELPACLQKNSTPYLTTIHASRNNIRLSEPQKSVRSVCKSVFTHKPSYPLGRGKKRTGCMFSRLSLVQGPVKKHAQIQEGVRSITFGRVNPIKNYIFGILRLRAIDWYINGFDPREREGGGVEGGSSFWDPPSRILLGHFPKL